MKNERDIVYLAALLHDIGKFWQRADANGSLSSKILDNDTKANLTSMLCPEYNNKYSHKHVLWTAQFFKEMSSHLGQLVQNESSSFSTDQIMMLSAKHHKPDKNNWLQLLLQKADHYASGHDRASIDSWGWKDAEEEDDKKWDSFRRIPMRSIFEGIDPDNAEKSDYTPTYHKRLDTVSIELTDRFFPKEPQESLPNYEKLWSEFMSEAKFIQSKTFKVFAETILFLLEKYTSRIPSSTVHLPDVSLYDHSKMVAAFAVALYDFSQKSQQIPSPYEKPFALVGGDLSGIQKFIYGIIPRGAAKNLKGRSFYLQLLVDTIVSKVLNEFNLFDANVVYASGGGFYIIVPNKGDLQEVLKNLEKEITQKLFDYHGTELYLALEFVPFGEAELYYDPQQKEAYESGKKKSIGHVWKELSDKIGEKKGQRFKYQLSNDYARFFSPGNEGGNKEKDAITGEDLKVGWKTIDNDLKVNAYTYQQIELGKKLKSTQYWIQSEQKLKHLKDEECFQLIGLEYFNYFITKEKLKELDTYLQTVDNVRVIFFNNNEISKNKTIDFLETVQKGINNIYGFKFYGGNDYPASNWDESPKTFEEITGIVFEDREKTKRKSAPNLVRMGVLRMDVDRLGSIFQKGFAPAKRSFSRYSTLSRSLDYFFKGYLNQIWAENADYKAYTQIIYSGGDDLFIVGKWDVLANMAVDINHKFREWTCGSANFTLSGGMAVVGPKYPLLKAALLSETYEKAAKDHEFGEEKKNAFSVFGYSYVQGEKVEEKRVKDLLFAFNWDKELPYVLDLKDHIAGLLNKGLSQGFPSDAYNLMQQADFQLKDGRYQIHNFAVIWMAAYNFKRAIQSGASDDIKDFLKEWVENLMTHRIKNVPEFEHSKYHPLQLLALAARWAALEKRSELK